MLCSRRSLCSKQRCASECNPQGSEAQRIGLCPCCRYLVVMKPAESACAADAGAWGLPHGDQLAVSAHVPCCRYLVPEFEDAAFGPRASAVHTALQEALLGSADAAHVLAAIPQQMEVVAMLRHINSELKVPCRISLCCNVTTKLPWVLCLS